jgi:excisionase family DNA binding protein
MAARRAIDTVHEEEKKYSRREAAARLGVSEITLFRWTKAGRIGFYRLGARVIYGAQHLRAFLDTVENRPFDGTRAK